MVLGVRVLGDSATGPFDELTHTLDIAMGGVRLGGMQRLQLRVGDVVEIRRKSRRGTFKVMWVGESGTPRTGQMGLQAIEVPPDFWGLEVPAEGEAPVPISGRAVHQAEQAG
ncbi:MAG: hypothetical protein ACXVZV_14025 [Terriglobales bacterium]